MRRGSIPVVDLFAGPGGLGEGFSAFLPEGQNVPPFGIALSIEKDAVAHQTLELRAFFRAFERGTVPEDYYAHLRGQLSRVQLFDRHPAAAASAAAEAWNAELGNSRFPPNDIDERVRKAVSGSDEWVLIGGPPCQAYSLVGRSRMRSTRPDFDQDPRHFLYREYLRILAEHRPPVFVMENVKGLLSSRVGGNLIFERICDDLREPQVAMGRGKRARGLKYELYPLVETHSLFQRPEDFVIRSEEYGVPQSRHRVIILGIRSDCNVSRTTMTAHAATRNLIDVIADLPRVRSRLSRGVDSKDEWIAAIADVLSSRTLRTDEGLFRTLQRNVAKLPRRGPSSTGGEFVRGVPNPQRLKDWFVDKRLQGFCNHTTRGHIATDLRRYFFAACWIEANKALSRSPRLSDFPRELLPEHGNVAEAVSGKMFGDRFRVQLPDHPSSTVTSHISKDGHYFIHFDPLQCRSLTVREAARLQTFPDNYFFCGPRTEQYRQVGNAVPPLLATQIARIVHNVLSAATTKPRSSRKEAS